MLKPVHFLSITTQKLLLFKQKFKNPLNPFTANPFQFIWNSSFVFKIEADCKDSCVEGCSCKGNLIYDRKEKCCIERSMCICTVLEGVPYGEGDKIYTMSDECKSWWVSL